jgi:hypothetical protein
LLQKRKYFFLFQPFLSLFIFVVGENIIGAPKIQNNYGAIQLLIFTLLQLAILVISL